MQAAGMLGSDFVNAIVLIIIFLIVLRLAMIFAKLATPPAQDQSNEPYKTMGTWMAEGRRLAVEDVGMWMVIGVLVAVTCAAAILLFNWAATVGEPGPMRGFALGIGLNLWSCVYCRISLVKVRRRVLTDIPVGVLNVRRLVAVLPICGLLAGLGVLVEQLHWSMGLLLAPLTMFGLLLSVDRGHGALSALWQSVATVTPHYVRWFVFYFLISLPLMIPAVLAALMWSLAGSLGPAGLVKWGALAVAWFCLSVAVAWFHLALTMAYRDQWGLAEDDPGASTGEAAASPVA